VISDRMQKALNEHVDAETFSAYLYFSMAAHFDHANLPGFAHWMKVQAQEELQHALKTYDFINERGARVRLGAIEAPDSEWESPLAVFEAALAHEREVTERIYKLADLAEADRDRATRVFLEWFISEQVEEESTADGICQQLRMIEDSPQAIFMLDRELGQRQPGPPPP